MSTKIKRRWINLDYTDSDNALRAEDIPFDANTSLTTKVDTLSSALSSIVGPSSATDNAIVRFDATTGRLVQNSNVTITDAGNIVLSGTVDGRDISVDGTKLDTIETNADVTDTANVSAALNNALVAVTAVDSDYVLIQDASDSFKLKKALKTDFGSGGSGSVSSAVSSSINNEIVLFSGSEGNAIKQSGMFVDSTSMSGSLLNFDVFNVSPATSALVSGDVYIYDNGTDASINYYNGSMVKSVSMTNNVTIPVRLTADTEDNALVSSIVSFRMPHAMTLTNVRGCCSTAPSGSNVIIDINESGTSILSGKLIIDSGEETSTTAATPVGISDFSIADDAKMTFDFDGIGSTTPGKGTIVWLIGYRS